MVHSKREYSLDFLRGAAALLVLFSHTTIAGLYGVEPIWSELKWTPLKILWSGHQAVILFFVLSGFALTKMWESIGSRRYDAYIAARVVRLYPPYIASIAVALVVYWVMRHLSPWAAGWMNVPNPILGENVSLIDHLLMIGNFNPSAVNPPIWSIIHEMRISLIFPIIYFVVRRFGVGALVGFLCVSMLVSWTISGVIPLSALQAELLISLHYVTFFAFGSFIALNQDSVCELASKVRGRIRVGVWVVALLLYAYPFDNPWSLSQRMIGDIGTGIGSFMLVAMILTSAEGSFLSRYRFLGGISYSMYLNHILALNICLILLYKSFGSVAVWVTAIPFAIILSWGMCALVEKPTIAMSRQVRRIILDRRKRLAEAA